VDDFLAHDDGGYLVARWIRFVENAVVRRVDVNDGENKRLPLCYALCASMLVEVVGRNWICSVSDGF
jgi:hypothetical protein